MIRLTDAEEDRAVCDMLRAEEDDYAPFESLVGKTLVRIDNAAKGAGVIILHTDNGERYVLWHEQDCCEVVWLEDIAGDVSDLIGSPILIAEESSNSIDETEDCDGITWTFYKLATARGNVTLRWYGSSNGYYSERVSFARYPTEETN